jgi:hypothetical protein
MQRGTRTKSRNDKQGKNRLFSFVILVSSNTFFSSSSKKRERVEDKPNK